MEKKGNVESTKQRVCDQGMAIRNNGWTVETDVGIVEEQINDAENSVGDTDGYLSEEH